MTPDEIKATLLRVLGEIAPEADPATIKMDIDLRDQLDIDSMDFLNFVIGINEELHVDIPESDYPRLVTLDGFVDYLSPRLPVQA
jgi:acyl carrier protein